MATDEENVDIKLKTCSESSLDDPYKAHIIYSQEDVAFSNESDIDYSEESTDDYLEVIEAVRLPVLSVSQRIGHLITGQLSKLRQDEEFSFPAHKVLKDDETQTESVTQTTASANRVDLLQVQSTIRTFAEILIAVVRLSKVVSPEGYTRGEIDENKALLEDVLVKFNLLEKEISENFGCDVNKTTERTELNPMGDVRIKEYQARIDSVEGDAAPTGAQPRPSPVASLCRLSGLFQQAMDSEGLSRETGLKQGQDILASDMMNILSVVREMIDDVTRQINSMTENDRKTNDIGLNAEIGQSSISDVITDDANDAKTEGSCSDNAMDSHQADTPLGISSNSVDTTISVDDLALFFSALSLFASESGLSIETSSEPRDKNNPRTSAGDTSSTDSMKSEGDRIQGSFSPFDVATESGSRNNVLRESVFDLGNSDEFGEDKISGKAGHGDQEFGQEGGGGQELDEAGSGGQETDKGGAGGQELVPAGVGGQESGHANNGSQTGIGGQESGQTGDGGQESGQADVGGQASAGSQELGQGQGQGQGRSGSQESGQADNGAQSVHEDISQEPQAGGQESGQAGASDQELDQAGTGGQESGQAGDGGQGSGHGGTIGQESGQDDICDQDTGQAGIGGEPRAGGQESGQAGAGVGNNKSGQDGVVGQRSGQADDQKATQISDSGGKEHGQDGKGGQESIHKCTDQELGQENDSSPPAGDGGDDSDKTDDGEQESGQAGGGGKTAVQTGADRQNSGQDNDSFQGSNQTSIGGQKPGNKGTGGCKSGKEDISGEESDQGSNGDPETSQGSDDNKNMDKINDGQGSGPAGVDGQKPDKTDVSGEGSGQKGYDNQDTGVCSRDSDDPGGKRKTGDDLQGKILRARPSHSDTCISTGKRGRLKSLISDTEDKTTHLDKRKSQAHAQPKKTGNEQCLGKRLIQATCAVVSLAGLMGAMVKGPSGSSLIPALLDDMSRILDMEYI